MIVEVFLFYQYIDIAAFGRTFSQPATELLWLKGGYVLQRGEEGQRKTNDQTKDV